MSSQSEQAELEKNTGFLDGAAIGLSALCAIHCLALPIALTMLPVIATIPLGDESFHKALLFLVIPASAIGLTLGCRRHQQWGVMFWGVSGLLVMTFAALFGHDLFGEDLEKTFELAQEIENICHQYINAIRIGIPKILSKKEMKIVLGKFKNYKKG